MIETRVGIVGGGPAGLMLFHLLAGAGIDSVVVDNRTHETIRTTHRAGILEHGAVALLVDSGPPTGYSPQDTGTRASTCASAGRAPHRLHRPSR